MAFALAIALAMLPGGSTAAEFLVDSESDVIDANPGDGVCDTGLGDCTLRAAVMEANAFLGSDTILLPAGDYVLTIPVPGNPMTSSNDEFGDLDVLEDLRIEGNPDDPALVVIRPYQTEYPLIDAEPGVHLVLEGVTLRESDVHDLSGHSINMVGGQLELRSVIIEETGPSFTGAVSTWNSDVQIFDSRFLDNQAEESQALQVSNGDLLVVRSRFESNCCENYSAIRATGGQVTILDSEFVNNFSSTGIAYLENALVHGTRFEGNSSGIGPMLTCLDCRIEQSSFTANRLADACDPVVVYGTNTELVGSTVSGNFVDDPYIDEDSNAVELDGDSRILNSTISGNQMHAAVVNGGNLTVKFSTIANNFPPPGQLPDQAALYNAGAGQLFLKGSIVANNAQDCADPSGGIQSLGFNVIGVSDGCPALVPAVSDVVGTQTAPVDPRLKPLALNGGLTQTHALLGTSPAKDLVPVPDCTVDDDLDPATPPVPLLVDQLGRSRPKGARCDAGAFERIPPAPFSCGLGPELGLVLPIVGWARTRRNRRLGS